MDINTVRQMAGHADISTTTIYDKRDHAFMKQAAAMLDYIPPDKPIKRGAPWARVWVEDPRLTLAVRPY